MDFTANGTILFKVGAGLYEYLQKEIQKEYTAAGVVLAVEDSQRFLQGDRDNLNFKFRFNAFYLRQFPNLQIKLVHEEALDPVFANDISNPYVDGNYRLSSFTGIIYDLNDIESDNIKLVKWKYDDKMRYQKQIGNVDWEDKNATFFSSGNFSGIKGRMSLRHAGMWLVDPTKTLMFEMNNPYS